MVCYHVLLAFNNLLAYLYVKISFL